MALNQIFAPTWSKNRARDVPVGTQAGTPLIINARPAVTITARGDATKTDTPTGLSFTSITYKNGGVGLAPTEASVAYDGTYEFPVATVTTGTANDVEVFINAGALTLVSAGGVHYGWTDYPKDFRKEAGRAAVRVGN
jgi:hypothetical protein